jgi:hypothetical protein
MPKNQKGTLLLCLLVILFFFTTGCSQEEVKKSENATRIRTLYDSLDLFKRNYEAKSSSDFFAAFSSSYSDIEKEKKRTADVFNRFNLITLNFYLDHIILEDAFSSLVVRWEGEWAPPSEGPFRSGGTSILKFSTETPPRLIGIQGIDPFTAPITEKRP